MLVTHGNIGAIVLQAAIEVLGICPLASDAISVAADCDPGQVLLQAQAAVDSMDSGDGVLVMTDMYGATPGNIACRIHNQHGIRVVAGLNLPMLIRVLNYPQLSLDELAIKAVSGGLDGVLACKLTEPGDAG